MMPEEILKNKLREKAVAVGFDAVRFTDPNILGEAGARLEDFLAEGFHGDMVWMADHAARRADPRVLWPDVRSIVMLGMNYGPEQDPMSLLNHKSRGVISVYAQGKDYHDVIKKKLKTVARWLVEETSCEVKVFVDTAPVMEKPLAAAAGLGWQGKHTNLVSRSFGSWLFLGAIYTTAEIEADNEELDHCGSCRKCLDVCPTGAFPRPYQLDARRCISYLTIEHKGHIDRSYREKIGNRIYGCDDCLAVCPWNKWAQTASEQRFHPRDGMLGPALSDLLRLDDKSFRSRFAGTPVKRTGRDRFMRNVLIAAGNSGDGDLLPAVIKLLSDSSAIVRAMAVWATIQLADKEMILSLKAQAGAREADKFVLEEWNEGRVS